MSKRFLIRFVLTFFFLNGSSYSLNYPHMDEHAKGKVTRILKQLEPTRKFSKEIQIQHLAKLFTDIPYRFSWHQTIIKKKSSMPLFSSEHFDCVTYVQMILALLNAHDINEFETLIISIAYDLPSNKAAQLGFLSQNHFIDADWNRVNERNGILKKNNLMSYAKKLSVMINKEHWLKMQKFPFTQKIAPQKISISYLPKDKLVAYDGTKFVKNNAFYNFLATPAIIEIIRDPDKWRKGRYLMRMLLGSETSVSHMGILYRKNFKRGDLIYHKIICQYGHNNCTVMPIYCRQQVCPELMLSHATISYPNGYLWQKKGKEFACLKGKSNSANTSFCNRVENIPLFNYLTDLRDGYYNYMMDDSILGFYLANL